jgi:hypothetical protein
MILDNVIESPKEYVADILKHGFQDVSDGENNFKGIQPRSYDDEFGLVVKKMFPNYVINWNFIRQSPLGQKEPNFIHTDEMMGDLTAILYLNEERPLKDGTTLYDREGCAACIVSSAFNRMIVFDSGIPHSRNLMENFGEGDKARLIQVAFLKRR